jgi:hypothetical protein
MMKARRAPEQPVIVVSAHQREPLPSSSVFSQQIMEEIMGFGRGALHWLLGVPLPIIILLALFWHH